MHGKARNDTLELARELVVSRSVISWWVNDRCKPTSDRMQQLAAVFKVDVAWLKGEEKVGDKELLRNGSGYVDPTAYKAIQKLEKKEPKMKRGEIWEIEYGPEYKCAVVIAVHDKSCNVLVLNDEKKTDEDLQVIARGMKYTDARLLSYKMNKNFVAFVRTMKDEEFEVIMEAVREILGFDADGYEEAALEKIAELKGQLKDQERNLASKCKHIEEMQEEIRNLKSEKKNIL